MADHNNEKENSLPETVTQNTEPIDLPSKLDASGVSESNRIDISQSGTRSEALHGEHSEIVHANKGGRITSEWQGEANAAANEADISPDDGPRPAHNQIDPIRRQNLDRQINPINRERDTSVNAASRGTNGVDAQRGEHSQVDAMGNGGTTRDWKNMPSSAYKGVAGMTDRDRKDGEMSLDWDGTAASEHPDK